MKIALKDVDVKLVTTRKEIDRNLTDRTLLILDEADHFYLNEQQPPVKAKFTVGFSATTYSIEGGVEATYYDCIGVKMYDGKLNRGDGSANLIQVEDVADFIDEYCGHGFGGLLVYCKAADMEKYRQAAFNAGIYNYIINCKN